jgi:hypothetical protein
MTPQNETRPLGAARLQNPSCSPADGGQSIRPEFSPQASLAAALARILFLLVVLPDAAVFAAVLPFIEAGRQ